MTTIARELPEAVQKFLADSPKGLWIDNSYSEGGGALIETHDPAQGIALASVQSATPADVDRAVTSAEAAQHEWQRLPGEARGRILWRIADLVEDRLEELATLEVLDSGRPITIARGEIAGVVKTFRYFAGWATKVEGRVFEPSSGEFLAYARREPVGVCAGIIPWNVPLVALAWKVAPALAFGNVMVLKPAELTPLTAMVFAEITLDAGLPPGVLNVVNGPGPVTGRALAEHPKVRKIAFTGSGEVGRKISEYSLGNLKRVTLELGGKSPNIFFPDAPKDHVLGAAIASFTNSGQACTAGSRTFVHEEIYDEFLEGLVGAARGLTIGHGLEENTQMGPLISAQQADRVMDYIEIGRSEGRVVAGGERIKVDGCTGDAFIQPTVFVDVPIGSRIEREEIFGPVTIVSAFRDEDEVLALANDTEFGLAAGIWTTDGRRAHRLAHQLQAGVVWINSYFAGDPAAPFGGYKQSGQGREKGEQAMEMYTEVKSVWSKLS
ncbi:aldehyde dehydrogenase family protein [Dietzia lutea]|uniref:Aldehyde dehydrogenase domain-containing protein n=1 Tax=Dietzia lutea TaxID=546160 RepID=A0A2S1RCT6_9ACTN|nr:aldehyde dehydrogenase family protein [Dietzia lutea]AWH94090.1 hypothetical protein A6035_17170 [Dietzia lutea]